MKHKILLVLLLIPFISLAQPSRPFDPNTWLSTSQRNEQLKSKLNFSTARLLDESYFLIATQTDTFDKVNLVWNPSDSAAYTYNIADSTLNTYNKLVNDPDSGWITVLATFYFYDSNKNDTSEIQQGYDEVNEIWVNETRSTYAYDINGNVTNNVRYSWNDTTSSWVKSNQYLYDYDVNSNLTKFTLLNWTNLAWDSSYQEVYTYYTDNLLETSTDYQWLPDKTPDIQSAYYYNALSLDTQVIGKAWNGSTFKNSFMDTLVYDANKNLLSSTRYDWHNNATGFSLTDYKKEFMYDGSNRLVQREDYYGDFASSFYPLLLNKYEYDENDNLTYQLLQAYNSSSSLFENSEQTFYFYTDILSAVHSPSSSGVQYSIYPNPVESSCNLKITANDASHAMIKIVDVSGRTLKSFYGSLKSGDNNFEISLAGFTPGIYFIAVADDLNKTNSILKLVKQ